MVQTSFEPRKETPETANQENVEADLFGADGSEAVVVHANTAIAAIGEVSGEISRKDILLPRLQIIQSVGPLSRQFKPGDIVLSKEVCAAHEGEELMLVVLSVDKFFQERFAKFDLNGPRPLRFASEQAALDAGLVTEWSADGKPPTAEPIADIKILIKEPETAKSPVFSVEVDKSKWAPAIWTVQRTSYSRVAKRIFSARAIELAAKGLLSGLWSLRTRETAINGNLIKAPVLTLVGRNSDEVVAEIKALFGKTETSG
jgi:hypothetical protein